MRCLRSQGETYLQHLLAKLTDSFTNSLPFTHTMKVCLRFSHNLDEILCNIFNPSDCVRVIDGMFDLYLSYGDVKILMP